MKIGAHFYRRLWYYRCMEKLHPHKALPVLFSYPPLTFLFFIVSALIVDMFYPVYFLFGQPLVSFSGAFLILVGSFLIFYAQLMKNLRKEGQFTEIGPYSISRNPTYLGMIAIGLGLSCFNHSVFVGIATVVSFLFFHFLIIPSEESLLEERFGDIYTTYKGKVHRWL